MGPYVDAVEGQIDLPAKTDVVIIGGGIIGVSAALELARRGIAVTLCEKGHVAGEQSSRNWGWCRQAGRDEREMPLIVESMRLWRGLETSIGAAVGFEQCGTLYIGATDKERADLEGWLAMAMPYETQARMVAGSEFERLTKMPANGRFALFVPTDGRAEPQLAAPAIARAAIASGATLVSSCAVRTIERSAGRVSGVVTERGPIACSAVIIAAGAWSSLLCAGLDQALPQLKVLGSVLRTSRIDDGPESCTWMGQMGFRKRRDGGYTIGDGATYPSPIEPASFRFLRPFLPMIRDQWRSMRPYPSGLGVTALFEGRPAADKPTIFEKLRVLDPKPDLAVLKATLQVMADQYPAFRKATIAQAWAGLIDVTPDAIPYIDRLPGVTGVTVATGFSGHGFGIGPAAGRMAAQVAVGDDIAIDLTSMRVNRFSDGSPIVLGAEI